MRSNSIHLGYFILFVMALTSLLLIAVATPCSAQDLVKSRAILIDDTKALTINDVREREFNLSPKIVSLGFGQETIWIKLRIKTNQVRDQQIVLRIRQPYLDEVIVFDSANDWKPQVTGDRFLVENDFYRSFNLNVGLKNSSEERDVFIRISTTSSRMIFAEVLSLASAQESDFTQQLASITYLAFIASILISIIVYSVGSNDKLNYIFLIRQLAEFMWAFFVLGVARSISLNFAPMFIDKATSIFVVIYPASIAFFSIHLLKEYCPRKMFIVILWMIFWFCPFAIFAILTDHAMIALKINAGMAFIIVAVPFLAALTSRPDLKQHNPYVSKRTLSWIYGLTLAISATTILSYSGVLIPGFGENPFSLYALNLYSIASTILTSILMMARGRSRSRRLVLAESKIAAAQSEAQQERFGREQQEQLLAMLTHELKTPLAVLRMIDGTGSSSNKIISEAVQDLTSVVDRIVSANEFESGRLSFVPSSFDLIKEIQNAVANNPEFKRINIESSSSEQITSDRQLVGVVLKNLVENAINYSVGPVKIQCVKKKQLFIIHFENNIDINDDVDANRVFEKFYRSNFAHRKSGSGIGLYILQGIVGEILSGKINFYRSENRVVVTLEIPNIAIQGKKY